MTDFDKQLVALVHKAIEATDDKEEMGRICYHLARVACYLHAQEFGVENGQRLMNRVTEKIFEEIALGEANSES